VLRRLYGSKRDEVRGDENNYIKRKLEIFGFQPNIRVEEVEWTRRKHRMNDRENE
jgi:hypothetical protein